ncbi:MAG: Gfo/Idh/MocA family oxidoreductase, partial [Candidatus Poribacteria bacterium]|nr:Gfo/Idh/MocA family oxidoreductase [Candidatus Poribacteria bacterium]
MSDVRMGVVGCGSIAEIAHLPSITKRKEARLVAVCDRDEEQANAAAAKWGAERHFTDHRAMFDHANLDGVVI